MAASTRPLALHTANADVDGAQQLVPEAHFLRIGWLAKAHQRQFRQHDVVRQRFTQAAGTRGVRQS
jgi:hypothetical protein